MLKLLSVVLFLGVTTTDARAFLRASFSLRVCCQYAEHVIVVDESGTVKETWYGDVKIGDRIAGFPFGVMLRHPVGEKSDTFEWGRQSGDPKEVSGKRMVLFLVRDAKAEKTKGWKGVCDSDFAVTMAWIEDGKVFALKQLMNPGDLVMVRESDKIADFKKSAVESLEGWKAFRSDLALDPSTEKAAKLKSYLAKGSDREKWEEALKSLQWCGESGAAVLRGILNEPDRDSEQSLAIRHLVGMGESGRADVFQLIELERDYWKSVAAELPANWLKDQKYSSRWMRVLAFLEKPDAYDDITPVQRTVNGGFHEVLMTIEKSAGFDPKQKTRPSDITREIWNKTGR
jgi:hypothetical protein